MTERSGRTKTVIAPRRWRSHLVRGARCLEEGDLPGARRCFSAAYALAPEEPLVCLAWARELLRAGQVDGAEPLMRAAWARDPTLVSAGLSLARLLGIYRQLPDEAGAVLDAVEAAHGAGPASLLVRAEITLVRPGGHGEARELFERAGRLGADPAIVRAGLAKAFNAEGVRCSQAGEHHQALFALKRAADLDPGWSGPLNNSGAVFERMGQALKAQAHYRAALVRDPENAVALYNLADCLRRNGAHAEAARLYRRLLAARPDFPGARTAARLNARAGREPPGGPEDGDAPDPAD